MQTTVDIGINAQNGEYTIQLQINGSQVEMTPGETASLITELSVASSLALSNTVQPVRRVSLAGPSPAPAPVAGNRPRWKRKATSDYITHLPELNTNAEVYLSDKGWVAMVGDEVILDAVRSKAAAQEAVVRHMNTVIREDMAS